MDGGGLCVCVCFKDLSYNHLEELPSSLGYLTCLQKLSVSHNKLTCLPDSLGQLKSKTLCKVLWTDCGKTNCLIVSYICRHLVTHKVPDIAVYLWASMSFSIIKLSYCLCSLLRRKIRELRE